MIKLDGLSTAEEFFYHTALIKSDDEKMQPAKGVQQSYKDAAHSGANVMFRAKIKGQKMLDEGIPLHMTVKTFDKPEAMPLDEVKNKAEELDIHRPDPHSLKYEPITFTSKRNGNTYYMLKISGLHPNIEKLSDHFKGQGVTHDSFMAHITINKELHDKIKKEGISPHEVEFSPLMIEHGVGNVTHLFQDKYSHDDHKSDIIPPYKDPNKITASEGHQDSLEKGVISASKHISLKRLKQIKQDNHTGEGGQEYDPEDVKQSINERADAKAKKQKLFPEPETSKNREDYSWMFKPKLAKTDEMEDLEKGNLKNIIAGAAMVGTMATSHTANKMVPIDHQPKAGSHNIEANEPGPKYSSEKMLHTIASVESNNGMFVNHKDLGGMHSGEKAFGKYGLTPVVIRETIKLNQDLKSKHSKAAVLSGQDMQNYMHDNPGLEDAVAAKHLNRLEHHFGQNRDHIAYAWLNGVSGTHKAIKNKKDIANHWHVLKAKKAYNQPDPAKQARN